nr:hypothetical protein [Tanacetum cinerariifolium]
MSTQQDIYAASSENRSPMLNKENYVSWSSRLLRYAKSRQNGKLIHNSIIKGPYVKRMIPEPEWSRHVTIVHQTKDLHTADYTQLYDFLKYNQNEIDDLNAERLSKTPDPLAFLETSNNPYTFPVLYQDQPSFNQNYMQQPMTNPEDITDSTTAMNMALALMAKAFKLNYSTPTNNNQRISSNPRNRQIAQPGNLNGYNDIQNVENQNPNRNGNLVAAHAKGNATGHNGNQIRCYNFRGLEEAGIQLQAEEFDLMAVADLDEIEEVNANCILMANLQQASTSSTQTDKALVYDSDGSAEVSDQKDTACGTSANTKFEKQSILGKPPKECLRLILLSLLGKKIMCLTMVEQAVGNKMHKAFPLPGESSHWQYKFPLPVEGVPTARRMEIPLPRVCTAMMKKLPVKEN